MDAEGAPMIASLFLVLAIGPADPTAQGLGDAARRANDERGTNPAVRRVTESELAARREWELTPAGVDLYAAVRTELTAVRQARPDLHTRLYEASRRASRLSELEPVLAKEPVIVGVLEKYALTPGEYLRMDYAVTTAMAWWTTALPEALERHQIHAANVRFLRENPRAARTISQLRGVQWYDAHRFISQF